MQPPVKGGDFPCLCWHDCSHSETSWIPWISWVNLGSASLTPGGHTCWHFIWSNTEVWGTNSHIRIEHCYSYFYLYFLFFRWRIWCLSLRTNKQRVLNTWLFAQKRSHVLVYTWTHKHSESEEQHGTVMRRLPINADGLSICTHTSNTPKSLGQIVCMCNTVLTLLHMCLCQRSLSVMLRTLSRTSPVLLSALFEKTACSCIAFTIEGPLSIKITHLDANWNLSHAKDGNWSRGLLK